MGNRKPSLSQLLAAIQPQNNYRTEMSADQVEQLNAPQTQPQVIQQPISMINEINRAQIGNVPSQQATNAQDYDSAFLKLMQDRNAQIQAQQRQMSELQSQQPNRFKEADLSQLLAYGDWLGGTQQAASYRPPTAAQERKAMIEKLRGEVTKSQQSMSDDQLAYLKQKAQEQQAMKSEQRMLAKLGGKQDMLPGQRKADMEFGEEYDKWVTRGGRAEYERTREQLKSALLALQADPSLTGKSLALVPEAALPIVSPKTAEIGQSVKSTVINMVKQLGANPTDTDLREIQKSVWDKGLSPAANALKIQRFLDEQDAKAKAKDESARVFELNKGTLQGRSAAYRKDNLEIKPSDLQSVDLNQMSDAELEAYIKANGGSL